MDYLQNRMRRSMTVRIPVDPPVTLYLASLDTASEAQVPVTPAEALAAQGLPEVLRGEVSVACDSTRPAFVRGTATAKPTEKPAPGTDNVQKAKE